MGRPPGAHPLDIRQWLEAHRYSAQQILQHLRKEGFDEGYSIVKESVRVVRSSRARAFLTQSFATGECAHGAFFLRARTR